MAVVVKCELLLRFTLLLPLYFSHYSHHMTPRVCLLSPYKCDQFSVQTSTITKSVLNVCWNRFHNDSMTYRHLGTKWCSWPGGPEGGVSTQHPVLPWPEHPNRLVPSHVRTALLRGNTHTHREWNGCLGSANAYERFSSIFTGRESGTRCIWYWLLSVCGRVVYACLEW